ncbi:uncharacterized protein LOC129914078 [Episyrphus balteatus]|uniref:uncharacterized protein LOC129914078 n=1 Tax=Episyrphus balteatus TaxID=286459 RepID=UPI00248657FC|nr:uncharacterized protein LOC129914078 [Episyrphus balteatus]
MERFAIKIDKSLRANLYKICRLCGIDNPDKIKVRDDANIVNLEDGEPELWKKVFDCIGLMITKDDKMPQFMCTLCVDKINDFFEFREMCYATDGQTRKLLGIKGEPKSKPKAQAVVPSTSVDCKIDIDIKEPMPEVTPLRAGRKRRNADMDICKDIKIDETEDIKPSTTTNVPTNVSKKKRMKLSNITETETKVEPGTKPGPASKTSAVNTKKEPTAVNTKKEPKVEPSSKIPLSKKRLKTEPIVPVKENKKEVKAAKLTKLMKKKLKLEAASTAPVVPEEQEQQFTRKRKELIKLKKLPQVIIKAERLRKSIIDTKIKEEKPVVVPTTTPTPSPVPAAAPTKTKPSKTKEKCTICNEGFVNKAHLDKHVKATHIPTIQRYHCVQCNETLKKNMEIKNHNLWHKLSKTPFKCGKCSETSCSIYTYTKHIRDCNQIAYLDSHIPDWHCPDCSGNYETTYLFNIHSCVSKGLVCPGCEKSLKWKEDYFKHIPTCPSAFHRIPPYMTSNIQVKNEAELPTSPVPPPLTTLASLPVTTIVTVQSTPTTRITPPQMDSNQCVVIPGNISLHEEAGSSSPSKTSRKGKRITKKDLKRFDKLLKSTMTTLVSIKHEPSQGVDGDGSAAVGDSEQQPSSSEVIEPSEPPPLPPDSPPGSPMDCGGDDFHHNGDDTDSGDEQAANTAPKPAGTIKQEIIDEGYRDLYNNIEVNIKHEIEVNKSSEEESPQKKTTAEAEESTLATQKPILKLKITKEHGTLNSILMDSPKSEKKKKKKKRKEDRVKSPDKEDKEEQSVALDDSVAPGAPAVADEVKNNVPTEANLPLQDNVPITKETPPLACNKTVVSVTEEAEPAMPLPEIVKIKKEITEPELDETEEEASSQNTPSIVASSSGSLQISCVSEGVVFHRADENEEAVKDQGNLTTTHESDNWAEPIPSMELSLNLPCVNPSSSMEYAMTQDIEEEEIDIKPRLEDLIPIPMLQITSIQSGAEVIEKPVKTPVKRKRRSTVAKSNPIPKIVAVSSGNEVASYHTESEVPSVQEKIQLDKNKDEFDFSQIKIKEEIVDPGYYEDSNVNPEEEAEHEEEEQEVDQEEEEHEEVDQDEAEEEETEQEQVEGDEEGLDADEVEDDGDEQIETHISKKQAEENAYIASIDFNNLTIKQEKEYIDDGLQNPGVFEDDDDEDEEDACSDDNDSEDSSSDDDDDDDDESNKSDSESEREYRELPSEDDEQEELQSPTKNIEKPVAKENETTVSQKPLGLQILTVRSEFSCLESGKKTESENIDSDEKLRLTTNDTSEQVRNEKQMVQMEVDDECEPMHEGTLNAKENQPKLKNDEASVKIIDAKSLQQTHSENVHLEESPNKLDYEMSCSKRATDAAQMNHLDNQEKDAELAQICDDLGSKANEQVENNSTFSNYLSTSTLSQEVDQMEQNPSFSNESLFSSDHISTSTPPQEAAEQIKHNPSFSNERQCPSDNFITPMPSRKAVLESNTLDGVLYSGVSNEDSTSRLLVPEDIVDTNAFSIQNTQNVPETVQGRSDPELKSDIDTMSIDQSYNTALQTINKVSTHVDGLSVEAFGDRIGQTDGSRAEFKQMTNDGHPISTLTDIPEIGLSSNFPAEVVPQTTRFVGTIESCEQNLCDLPPPRVDNAQQNSSLISTPVQSDSHLRETVKPALSYSLHDDQIRYNEGNKSSSSELPPSVLEHTLQSNTILTQNHNPNAFENTNILMQFGNSMSNSSVDPSSYHDRQEFPPNTPPQHSSASVYNIPPPSSPMEMHHQFNMPGSSYATYNCNSDPTRFTDYQNLTAPTASLVHQTNVNQSTSELSTNSLTNLSVLSEEVQNLLNEDTVAVNNFEYNEGVLRARVAAVAPIHPVPVFNEFENLNEIAENNNNANIERELQDELGNVLADAIADRSNDDNVDDDNVMNENRANFDIT